MKLSKEAILSSKQPFNPIVRGIYILNHQDEIVYVGQSTSNVMARIFTHNNEKKMFDSYTIIDGKNLSDRDLNNLEAELFVQFRPRYNSHMPQNTIYASKEKARELLGAKGKNIKKHLESYGIKAFGEYYKVADLLSLREMR